MQKSKSNQTLEQAMALLIQNQASFVQNQSAFLPQMFGIAQTQTAFLSQLAEAHQRFVRIEQGLGQIKAILRKHEQILNELPDVIRQKIGFKAR